MRGVRAVATPHELRELLGVLAGEHPLEALHRVPGKARVVRPMIVGVDHANAGVSTVERRARGAGLEWSHVETLTDEALETRVYGPPGARHAPSRGLRLRATVRGSPARCSASRDPPQTPRHAAREGDRR